MGRSFYKLMSVNTGVSASQVLTMRVGFSDLIRKDWATKSTMAAEEVVNEIRSLPQVQQAALCLGGPLNGGMSIGHYPGSGKSGLYVEGQQGDQLSGDQRIIQSSVTPGYFAALSIRILTGRDFEPGDMTSPVAIVSQGFARKYISGNPLGKRFSISEDKDGHHRWMEIVGLVNDVRDRAINEPLSPVYYTPLVSNSQGFEIIAQISANPMTLVRPIERVVWSVDKEAPITQIETLDQIIANSAAEPRFQTALVGSFGALGLLLAIIGVYGVISYSVVQQTHEVGIRMALGAQRTDILHMIVREGMRLAIAGIAIGIGGALGLTRVLRSMLFEIEPTDPATYVGVAIFLTIAALAACYIPARRAVKVDPMVALRHE